MSAGTCDRVDAPVRSAIGRDIRPVMLLTFNVGFDREAVEFAVDSAVEAGAELWVCDAVPIAVGNPAVHSGRTFAEGETSKELDEIAERARGLGVRVTQMVFHNPKPVSAALSVVRDNGVGMLVFGPNRRRLSRWTFRRACKRFRREADCLVWTAS